MSFPHVVSDRVGIALAGYLRCQPLSTSTDPNIRSAMDGRALTARTTPERPGA
jgi:hypothetical protein